MKFERDFVVFPGSSDKAERGFPIRTVVVLLRSLRAALLRCRRFVAGILVGMAIWVPVFAGMTEEDPGALGVSASALMIGLAAAIARRGG